MTTEEPGGDGGYLIPASLAPYLLAYLAREDHAWDCQMLWRAGYRPRDAQGPCGCCESCHGNADMGYADMCEGTFKGREYRGCCRMAETLKLAREDDVEVGSKK